MRIAADADRMLALTAWRLSSSTAECRPVVMMSGASGHGRIAVSELALEVGGQLPAHLGSLIDATLVPDHVTEQHADTDAPADECDSI